VPPASRTGPQRRGASLRWASSPGRSGGKEQQGPPSDSGPTSQELARALPACPRPCRPPQLLPLAPRLPRPPTACHCLCCPFCAFPGPGKGPAPGPCDWGPQAPAWPRGGLAGGPSPGAPAAEAASSRALRLGLLVVRRRGLVLLALPDGKPARASATQSSAGALGQQAGPRVDWACQQQSPRGRAGPGAAAEAAGCPVEQGGLSTSSGGCRTAPEGDSCRRGRQRCTTGAPRPSSPGPHRSAAEPFPSPQGRPPQGQGAPRERQGAQELGPGLAAPWRLQGPCPRPSDSSPGSVPGSRARRSLCLQQMTAPGAAGMPPEPISRARKGKSMPGHLPTQDLAERRTAAACWMCLHSGAHDMLRVHVQEEEGEG